MLIHHLRKLNDDDPMDMISGITGLSGATGSNFVLRKRRRGENAATLYCTGRDIIYRIVFLLSALLWEQSEICVSAKALLEKIDPADLEGLTRNSLSHQIWKNIGALRNSGIVVSFRRWSRGRLICLKSVDGVDDLATEKIVTIDPYE